ncbi:hypothetical protein, partial [Stutzerimonas kunmingensis]|uniref:hypothetical protein n=1 Tax=Stutzerimonas kunmingensis TaxID=1211807 RepID=UPI0028A6F1B0
VIAQDRTATAMGMARADAQEPLARPAGSALWVTGGTAIAGGKQPKLNESNLHLVYIRAP